MTDSVTDRATTDLEEHVTVVRAQLLFMEMTTPLVQALSDLRLMTLASLGRMETIADAGVAPEELASIVRHVARLETEIHGLRADLSAFISLVQDLIRVPGTKVVVPTAPQSMSEYL